MLVGKSLALALVLLAGSAGAHVALLQKYSPADSYYKAVFQVGHGCSGAATTAISVLLPDGMRMAKPMPKPGWKLDIRSGKLARPFESDGKLVRDGVLEVRWLGGALPDAQFDEFSLLLKLPPEQGKRYFKVVQQCGKEKIEWTEIPAEGQDSADLAHPAPVLEMAPAAGSGGHHH
ncbi:nuclear export factor GLE1 [Jeongeupia sp. HS-3]|uniref:YcnI family copper-binding membrane protein n=1 Tax=Jeongeupia sp. HS-3 TaxID=1009682 RepID=UPI0018A35D97|nr:YcnI family protein [Jeongeupia sp. HS-3]BCL76872.1 nuclear export factor GLE1 [Jeongeupia sp. HS-3]